jgi:hypothetical protein
VLTLSEDAGQQNIHKTYTSCIKEAKNEPKENP